MVQRSRKRRNRLSPSHRLSSLGFRGASFAWPETAARRPLAVSSGAAVSTLAHIDGLVSRLGFGSSRQLAPALQSLESRAKANFPKRQQGSRYDEVDDIIEAPEQQPAREQFR